MSHTLAPLTHMALPSPAGQTLGDSIGPVVGAVLLDTRGARAVSIVTGALLTTTLPALAVLGVWWYRQDRKALQLPVTQDLPLTDPPASSSEGSWTSSQSNGSACGPSSRPLEVPHGAVLPTSLPCTSWALPPAPCKAGDSWVVESKDVTAVSDQWGSSATSLVDLEVRFPSEATTTDSSVTGGGCVPSHSPKQAPPQPMSISSSSEPGTSHAQGLPEVSVWGLLRQGAVLRECGVVMATQLLHGALVVLLPAAMYATPTWLLGVLLLGQAVGSVVSPFLLDLLLVWQPQLNTHLAQMLALAAMAVAAVGAMLSHATLCTMVISVTVLGAAQSVADSLAFSHMVSHLQDTTSFSLGLVTSGMSAFSLAYVLGGIVGPLVAAGPSHEPHAVVPQQLCVSAVAAVVIMYGLVIYGMHRRQQASKQQAEDTGSSE